MLPFSWWCAGVPPPAASLWSALRSRLLRSVPVRSSPPSSGSGGLSNGRASGAAPALRGLRPLPLVGALPAAPPPRRVAAYSACPGLPRPPALPGPRSPVGGAPPQRLWLCCPGGALAGAGPPAPRGRRGRRGAVPFGPPCSLPAAALPCLELSFQKHV